MVSLTRLAKKYTHPTGLIHDALKDTGKSGLTPIEDGDFSGSRRKELEDYQRKRFYGFTAKELAMAESLAPLIEETIELPRQVNDNELHPLLRKKNWQYPLPWHLARFPMRGRPGYWDVQNKDVWEVLKPVLKLVSDFITNAHHWPWYDALIGTKWVRIEDKDFPKNYPKNNNNYPTCARFATRDAALQDRDAINRTFMKLVDRAEFCLSNGFTDHLSGTYGGPGFTGGFSYRRGRNPNSRIVVCLAFQTLEALLRKDLTHAERAIETFLAASLMLHELSHMAGFLKEADNFNLTYEPYFENECITEVGHSTEKAIFGGLCTSLIDLENNPRLVGIPVGAVVIHTWPNISFSDYASGAPVFDPKPTDWMSMAHYSVPVRFIMDLENDGFWTDHIKRYGSKSSFMPKTVGFRRALLPTGSLHGKFHFEFDPHDLSIPEIIIEDTMSPSEVRAAEIENRRRQQASRICKTILATPIDRTNIDPQVPPGSPKRPPPEILYGSPRYDEIRKYLFDKRQTLALDTMGPLFPGHALLRHLQNSGLNITAEEWRNFLIMCDRKQELFKVTIWTDDFYQVVITLSRDDSTWPPLTPSQASSSPPPLPLSPELMRAFYLGAELACKITSLDENAAKGYCDWDWVEFREAVNEGYHLPANPTRVPGYNGFNDVDFRTAVYYHPSYINGPPGVIRKIGPHPPLPTVPTPAPPQTSAPSQSPSSGPPPQSNAPSRPPSSGSAPQTNAPTNPPTSALSGLQITSNKP